MTALLLLLAATAGAEERPKIAIIIDDLGDRVIEGTAAIELPGQLTYAFLPHTPHAVRLARLAHQRGKEVMLHLPMESVDGKRLGPGGVTLNMSHQQFRETVLENVRAIPHIAGLNNHMGSLLTQHPGHMGWLMSELSARGDLFFVDSRTAEKSIALKMAREYGVPSSGRDIFLDNQLSFSYISGQFDRALRIARLRGSAIMIGHTYAETMAALPELLPRLEFAGIDLVPVSEVISYRNQRRMKQWQASLSPSPTAAKNSKP